MSDGQVVVVYGSIDRDSSGHWLLDLDRLSGLGGPVLERYDAAGSTRADLRSQPVIATPNDVGLTTAVNVKVNDPANLAGAQKAAENVVVALIKIKTLLNDVPPDTPINWSGKVYTASQVLDIIKNTQFIVTDENYGNGGVGSASAGQNGVPNIDKLNFRYFDGDLSNSDGKDYASPAFTNGEGMVGIMLHEVAHLSGEGWIINYHSQRYFNQEIANGRDPGAYNSSDYWTNNESFANDFAKSAAQVIGADISALSNNWNTYWQPPIQIYNDHMGF